MCFSATASFGAGVVLSAVGVASLKQAQQPSHLPFAGIPLIFAAQQMAEGVVWLSLTNTDFAPAQQAATYSFLFFATILWPMWVPWAILLLEKQPGQRTLLKVLTGAGVLVGLYLAYCMVAFSVLPKIVGHHILYDKAYPASLRPFADGLYALAGILPAFISTVRRMWVFGTGIVASLVGTAIFYQLHVISVWCFFAALISITIYFIVLELANPRKLAAEMRE